MKSLQSLFTKMVRLQVLDLKDGTVDLPKTMPPKQITKQNYYYKKTHTHTQSWSCSKVHSPIASLVFSAFTEGNKLTLPKTMPPKQQITKQNYYLKKHPKLKLLQSPFTIARLVFFCIPRMDTIDLEVAGQCRNHFDAAKFGWVASKLTGGITAPVGCSLFGSHGNLTLRWRLHLQYPDFIFKVVRKFLNLAFIYWLHILTILLDFLQ